METGVPLALALAMAMVHLFAGRLRFLLVIPRSIWLSLAGGVSVAYVFVHLLPELSEGQTVFEAPGLEGPFVFLKHHVYLVALIGLAVFYGLEQAALASRREHGGGARGAAGPALFGLHLASFAVYNALIGYLLVHRDADGVLLYFLAMTLHFVVNDYGLREHFEARYQRTGRWVLAASIVAGWAVGRLTEIGEATLVAMFAFLAGGVVLNVLKEELPAERESRFWPFALGAMVYAALLLASG